MRQLTGRHYGFVKQSGGHVKIYSEVGQGTSIRTYFPRYYGDAGPAAAIERYLAMARQRQQKQKRRHLKSCLRKSRNDLKKRPKSNQQVARLANCFYVGSDKPIQFTHKQQAYVARTATAEISHPADKPLARGLTDPPERISRKRL
jgi:hypothetical protein